MKTIVLLKSDIPNTPHTRLFEIEDTLPLNVGDIFTYRASEPSKNSIETAQRRIANFENPTGWDKFKIQDIQRRMDMSHDQFEKWGSGVELVVDEKKISVYRGSDFLNDNVISTTVQLYVDIYNEAYIRNKRIEQVL